MSQHRAGARPTLIEERPGGPRLETMVAFIGSPQVGASASLATRFTSAELKRPPPRIQPGQDLLTDFGHNPGGLLSVEVTQVPHDQTPSPRRDRRRFHQTLGHAIQIKTHVIGNLSLGNSKETQIVAPIDGFPYTGLPLSLNAIRVVQEVSGDAR